jgi:hypothetical protein
VRVWWAIGGIVVAAAVLRWTLGRNSASDRGEMIRRAYATLRRGKPAAIAFAADGPVVIRGRVSAVGPPLIGPRSQRPRVFSNVSYRVLSAVRVQADSLLDAALSRGERLAVSTTTERDLRGQTFIVTDESGIAEVAFADVADVSFLVEPIDLPPPSEEDFSRGFPLRVATEEAALFVGDTVTVAGVGTREARRDSSERREPRTRYVVRAGADMVLMIRREDASGTTQQ